MKSILLSQKFTLIILVPVVILITVLSLVPELPDIVDYPSGLDKAEHAIAYSVLAFFLYTLLKDRGVTPVRSFLVTLFSSTLYGALIEVMQNITGRSMEAADIAADFTGAALGALLAAAVMKRIEKGL